MLIAQHKAEKRRLRLSTSHFFQLKKLKLQKKDCKLKHLHDQADNINKRARRGLTEQMWGLKKATDAETVLSDLLILQEKSEI